MKLFDLFNKRRTQPRTVNTFKATKNGFIEAHIESEQGKVLLEVIELLKTGDNKMLVVQKLETLSIKVTDVAKVNYRVVDKTIYLWINL